MQVATVIFVSGERLPMLLDNDGLPVVGPCEWILSKRHRAFTTLCRNMAELLVMQNWFVQRNIDLFQRLYSGGRFTEAEISSLVEQLRRAQPSGHKVQRLAVSPDTANKRIGSVIGYLSWCFDLVVTSEKLSSERRQELHENHGFVMRHLIEGRQQPEPRQKKIKKLTVDQAQFLQDVLDPDLESDFGRDRTVKMRNFLMIVLMLLLGVRPGEVLSLRVRDVEFGAITCIRVRRRALSLADSRARPASVKRAGRVLILDSPRVAQMLDDYILEHRERVLRRQKRPNEFLFLSDEGDPLSIDALQEVLRELRRRYPANLPSHLTAKALRHTFTDNIQRDLRRLGKSDHEIVSTLMYLRGDTSPESQDEYIDYAESAQEAIRRYQMKVTSKGNAHDVPF